MYFTSNITPNSNVTTVFTRFNSVWKEQGFFNLLFRHSALFHSLSGVMGISKLHF